MTTATGWERELLLSRLAAQREHILTALDGLSDDQLRFPVLPSAWSCLGLVRHLTVSDERYWFDTVMGGAALDYWPPEGDSPDDTLADWRVRDDEPADQVIAEYRRAIDRSDAVIGALELDAPPRITEAWWAKAGLRFPDLRSVIVHVIVETATHAGHLDAARELLDGRQHLVL